MSIPTTDGEISVFPSHEPLVTIARDGVITVRRHKEDLDNQLEYFAISGGVVKIDYSSVQILVDEADHGDDIIEAETQARRVFESGARTRRRTRFSCSLCIVNDLLYPIGKDISSPNELISSDANLSRISS